MAVAAADWADAETTAPDKDAPPQRVRPLHADEVQPAVKRVAIALFSVIGGAILFLVLLGWLIF